MLMTAAPTYGEIVGLAAGTSDLMPVVMRDGTYARKCWPADAAPVTGPAVHVTGSASGAVTPGVLPVSSADLVGPLKQYQGYIEGGLAQLSVRSAASALPEPTDGNGQPWITTYNPWNLKESTIEPSTPAFPNLADRTTTRGYDQAGRLATVNEPGGVVISQAFDALGNVTKQTGTGAQAGTVDHTYGYDTASRLTSAENLRGRHRRLDRLRLQPRRRRRRQSGFQPR